MSDATAAFELPDTEALAALDDAALTALADAARAEGVALSSAETFSTSDADRLEYLAASLATIEAQIATNATAVAELAERHATAAKAFAVVTEPVVELALEEPVVTEPVVDEPVVAAAVKPTARQIVAHAPKAVVAAAPSAPKVIVAAAADVPGLATGSIVQLDDLAGPIAHRWNAYRGAPQAAGSRIRHGLATLTLPFEDALVASGNNDDAVMRHAIDQSRLPGGGLIAAGGWCAPSETIYDVCSAGVFTGGFSLPEISAPRGGIRYTRALDYSTIATQIAALTLCATETQLVADPPLEKDCIEVDCPDFTEVRMDACWLCVKTALLQNKAYPEYVREFLRTAVVAHQNLMDTRTVNAVVTLLGAATVIPATFGTIAQLLAAIDLEAIDFRYKHSLPIDSTLEIVLPEWLIGALRDDYVRRQFNLHDDLQKSVINAYLAERNVSAQWIRNWQRSGFGQVANATAYPTTAQFMLYEAGSFVRLREDIIRVDSLSDSALLTTNRQLGLFLEEGWAVAPMCKSGRLVTFSVCNSGTTGGPIAGVGAFACGQA